MSISSAPPVLRHLSVSSRLYLLRCFWCVSALPQLDLGVSEAQLPQAGQLLFPVLQGLELGQAPHSGRLLPKRPIECRRGEALPLGYASVRQNLFQSEISVWTLGVCDVLSIQDPLTALTKTAAALSKTCFKRTPSKSHGRNVVSDLLQ